jgi:hypothetical protein
LSAASISLWGKWIAETDLRVAEIFSGKQLMAGNPKGIKSLAKYTKLPIERVKYVSDADGGTVRSIRRGVLFMMAFWSGPSVRAFSKLTEVVARLDGTAALEFVVADVDGSPGLYEIPEFKDKIHGWGETAWVRDGKIVATSGLGLNIDCFEPNTAALLSMA